MKLKHIYCRWLAHTHPLMRRFQSLHATINKDPRFVWMRASYPPNGAYLLSNIAQLFTVSVSTVTIIAAAIRAIFACVIPSIY